MLTLWLRYGLNKTSKRTLETSHVGVLSPLWDGYCIEEGPGRAQDHPLATMRGPWDWIFQMKLYNVACITEWYLLNWTSIYIYTSKMGPYRHILLVPADCRGLLAYGQGALTKLIRGQNSDKSWFGTFLQCFWSFFSLFLDFESLYFEICTRKTGQLIAAWMRYTKG